MAKASDNKFPYLHLVPAAAPASPAAGSQRLYLDSGDSNKLKRKDSAGTVVTVEGGGGAGFAPVVKFIRYTATSNIKTPASTSFLALTDSAGASLGTALDLTLPSGKVAAGDTVEVGAALTWGNDSVDAYLTFGSLVSSSIVNFLANENGVPGLWGTSGAFTNAAGSSFYVVQSGDLSAGALTVRPLGKSLSGAARSIILTGTSPNKDTAGFWLKNWGPQ